MVPLHMHLISSRIGCRPNLGINSWQSSDGRPNPCDYYLWGYLKSVVYYPLPETLAELKINLEREIKKIPENILKKDVKKFFP